MSEAFALPGLPPQRPSRTHDGHRGGPPAGTGPAAVVIPIHGSPVATSPDFLMPQPAAGQVGDVDWSLVRVLRAAAANQISEIIANDPGADLAGSGRRVVEGLVADHITAATAAGNPAPSRTAQAALAQAVTDALFGLGRLQPIVDDPRVENIEINGCDNVTLVLADGRVETAAPVADTDEELIEQLAFLAARSSANARMFSAAHPRLHLTLHGGARLAATNWVTPRPTAVIRIHRLREVTLGDLVARDMLDSEMAEFLAAAVRAGKSVVVSGAQGSGKTTLIRALAAELDPWERIGTLETERELHLHELPSRHRRIVSWEARAGSGERGPDGRLVGEITLEEIVADSLRFNLSRLIVGEVRGKEVLAMFQAMQTGAGSMTTTHAHSARAAIERLVTCALEAGPQVSEAFAYRQVAAHINLIVQTTLRTTGSRANPRRERFICEIIAVEPGENGRPATTSLWRADPSTGRAVRATIPADWDCELAAHGWSAGAR